MDVTQAAPFHQALVAMKEALLTQLAEQRGGTIGRAEAAANHFGQPEDSRAQLATARDLEFAVDERETAHLAAVEAALERIGAGTYGECSDCGADIPQPGCMPPPRLRAASLARRNSSPTTRLDERLCRPHGSGPVRPLVRLRWLSSAGTIGRTVCLSSA